MFEKPSVKTLASVFSEPKKARAVIYWRGAYRVQSLGDFVETMERQWVHFV